MKRLPILALSLACVAGIAVLSSATASAQEPQKLTLLGNIDGLETDGAFPAQVTLKNPRSKAVIYQGEAQFCIEDGTYYADLDDLRIPAGTTVQVEIDGLDAAEDLEMVSFVELQGTTPGSAQVGHLNISGYVLAGRVGLGTSPTIARLQVNETGTAQGVRAITNTGVAVYGQATAGTGLGAGGYFTSSSIGGRAVVGDALSTSGSTVGGLFYNRSTDGVAVWGKHINTSGNSVGVFGQTASSTGSAIVAENQANGDKVTLGGVEGTILTEGALPRQYYGGFTPSTMVPLAFGMVSFDGLRLNEATSNWTVSRTGTGVYSINIGGMSGITALNFMVCATPISDTGGSVMTYTLNPSSGQIQLRNWSLANNQLTDTAFSFVVFSPRFYVPPQN